MKKSLLIIALFFASLTTFSQVSVRGYYKSNGTYVKPHQRTAPNYTINDNYSTVGNINPYTGKAGTVARDNYSSTSTYSAPTYSTLTRTYSSPSYSSSRTIYTGSRGGKYYINSNGNKSYVSGN